MAPVQLIDTVNDDGTTMVEIDVSRYSHGAGKLRIPQLQRGHPFISRGTHTATISPQHLRAERCDAEIIPQILGTGNVVLDRGRATRTYPNWWRHGGKTSSQNVTLLCPKCHSLVHKGGMDRHL